MKERTLTTPEIGLIAGTRVALGVGIGLLISDRLNKDQRKAAGWSLLGVGLLTTIPIVAGVLGKGPFAERPVGLAA
jgi:multisubunit Na+/H+ antiporter MnhB subunit